MSAPRSWASTIEIAGLCWALGLAAFTSASFALWALGMPWSTSRGPALALTAAVLAVGARAFRSARGDQPVPRHTGSRALTALALASVLFPVGLAASLALRAPLSAWDAWSIWAFKGCAIAGHGLGLAYFHDPLTLYTHPDYPLNVSIAEASLLQFPGAVGSRLIALLGVACLASLLLVFQAGLARLYGRVTAIMAGCALAMVPALPLQAAGGDADVPLAMYAGAAALYLLLWWRFRRPIDALLCAFLAGGAIWTKKEGLPIALLLLAAFVVAEAVRADVGVKERLAAISPVLAAVALPLPWMVFARAVRPSGRDFLPVTPEVFVSHAGRFPHIVASFALQMLSFAHWSLLWVMLAAVTIASARRLSPIGRALLALLAAQLGTYVLAFVFSDWQPYTAHVQTSLDRLMVQSVPLACLLLVEAVQALGCSRHGAVAPAPSSADDVAA